MRNYYSALILSVFLFFLPCKVIFAQISFGGKPLIERVALPTPPIVEIATPDLIQIKKEDDLSAEKQQPYRVGVSIKTDCDFIQRAQQTKVSDGTVWRLMLRSRGAKALSVTFGKFYIPEQGQLFMYDINLKKKIGAFTFENNLKEGEMAFEILPGESIILEYFQPSGVMTLPQLVISELLYIYRSSGYDPASTLKDFGIAGNCEVNVNCNEGTRFSNQKRGVVRILIYSRTGSYWCTGSVVNNTNRDFKPYILSAGHCREGALGSDFDKWIFYFNYEAPGCPNPLLEPASKTMSGASLISIAGNTGNLSDFMLVQLNQSIPIDYNAWYFGWNREILSNVGAVVIHHPEGDIKKISTVLDTPVSVAGYGGNADPNGTFWAVNWRSTTSGFGVTEQGSSGSPLINKNGEIIGTLSGGTSDCTHKGEKDYFGKVSAHWTLNGTTLNNQLGPWLDPLNTGISMFSGTYYNNTIIAQFSSDAIVIPPGFSANFNDLSYGNPTKWSWNFVGGVPSTSNVANPQGIRYNKTGNYDVQLIVANNFQRDTLLLKKYIQVKAQVYPNPTNGMAELFVSKDILPKFDVQVSNVQGMLISKFTVKNTNKLALDFTNQPIGIYLITVYTTGNTQTFKIVVAR